MKTNVANGPAAANTIARAILAIVIAAMCAIAVSATATARPAYALQVGSIGSYYINGYIAGSSFAASPSNVTLKEYSDTATIKVTGCSTYPGVTSSNSSVVMSYSVTRDYSQSNTYNVVLKKKGVGTATVAISDRYGNTRRVNVTCNPTAFRINHESFAFNKASKYTSSLFVGVSYDSAAKHYLDNSIVKVKNSKKSVVSAKIERYGDHAYVVVTPKNAGKAKLTLTDQYGNKKTVKISVAKNFFKHNLKARTHGYTNYGEKTLRVYTAPKAKVTVKIGNERHSAKADKNGQATIKLKKVRKMGTKFTVTAKTAKAKTTSKGKVGMGLEYATSGTVWSCKSYFPTTAYNLHKGDTVTVSAGGETLSYKVTTELKCNTHYFWFRYTMRNYRVVNIKITNKYGQVMYSHNRYLYWR